MESDNKLSRTRKVGYKRIVPKEKEQKEKDPVYFDVDAQTNWLFPDDPEYKKKRKSKKKLKKKK